MSLHKPIKTYQRWWQFKSHLNMATLPAHTLDCPECGLRTDIPSLQQGEVADCPRCDHRLVQVEVSPYITPLAYASASLILMAFAYTMMFITVELPGMTSILTLPGMMRTLIVLDFGFLAEAMFLLTFGLPVLFLLLCIYVYSALWFNKTVPGLLYATRTLTRLRHWIMVDVFFISTLVAYIKIGAVSQVTFGPAFGLMFVLSILLIRTSLSIQEHWVYYQIHSIQGKNAILSTSNDRICCSRCLYFRDQTQEQCGVCGADLFARRPKSLALSTAFLIAAAILYIPANNLFIMVSANPIQTEINTILSGIIFMWRDGDKLVALIIFSASILVPSAKIISMTVLLLSARFGLPMKPQHMSLLYRLTETVGRWSMIDIFVIIILMSAFHSPIARITPGPAAVYFCLVVIFTMISAYFFDPRLLWDKSLKAT